MSEAKKMDTPEQAAFRAHCKEWLASNHPGRPTVKLPLGALELSNPDALAWLQKWQKSAYDAGLIGCDYPKELGGGGMENCSPLPMQKCKGHRPLTCPILLVWAWPHRLSCSTPVTR